jgi:hypothetical protein
MAIRDCIGRAVGDGQMTPDRAERILREYDNAFDELRQSMGHTQAEIEAARRVQKQERMRAAERRRTTQLQAAATTRQVERMIQHRDIRQRLNPSQYLKDVVDNPRGAGGATINGQYQVIRRRARGQMNEAVRTFRANLFGGRRNRRVLQQVVQEVFGESTGNPAAARMAQAWRDIAEGLRTRFNAAGGHIAKLDGWGLPQVHDARRIARAGFEEWSRYIDGVLDWDGMAAIWNDGLPYSAAQRAQVLHDAYEVIRTEGYSRTSPSARHGSAMYNRRADHRFFKFKDAATWSEYSERFGAGRDTFRVMLGHIDSMAMDIAMMEELGPNPTHTYLYLQDVARMMGARSPDPKGMERAARHVQEGQGMLDAFTGAANVPVSVGFAKFGAAVRGYLPAAQLGSAIISSVTDFNYQRSASAFAGLGQTGWAREFLRVLTSPKYRNELSEAGLIFENAVEVGNAVGRYSLEDIHIEAASRMSDFTIRASGLGWLTEVQRQTAGGWVMNRMAKASRQPWPAMDPRTQRFLEAYGIRETDWPAIQRARLHETANGLQILRAQEIEEAGSRHLADRYLQAVVGQQEIAVPSDSVIGRTAVLFGTKPGTIPGEAVRFGLQYKAHPVAVISMMGGRLINEISSGRPWSALGFFASLFIGNTVLGAMAVQMKDVSKGRDPRDMTTPEFWVAAMLQGGALGLFGDFLFSDVNRFGRGLTSSVLGPAAGLVDDVGRFTLGNARELALGEETNAGREFVDLLRRYTPGGSLWQIRLLAEREVFDRLQIALDPDAYDSFRARERGVQQYGTEFFMPPGSSAIMGRGSIRPPDIENAFGR